MPLSEIGNQVHLWELPLIDPAAIEQDDLRLLSADENARATRFRFPSDRQRFIAGRASLRRILAQYLGKDPSALRFSYGAAGKPKLLEQDHGGMLHFNLAHSEDWGLLAIARSRTIGVDLERVRFSDDLGEVAKRFFAPAEGAALEEFAPPLYEQAFFACWTRKEAFLKALGTGLNLPLDGFCVSVDPRVPARLISTEFRPAEVKRWSLLDVALRPPLDRDFRAALAVEGAPPVCRYFRLGEEPLGDPTRRAASPSEDR